MTAIDVSVVITAHREGALAGITAKSAIEAMAYARDVDGIRFETIIVLDRADATTSAVLKRAFGDDAKYLCSDHGDPGQARNCGVAAAQGHCTTFLDGDDLWSKNWLSEAWRLIQRRPDCVAHSTCNIIFDQLRNVWWHVDSEGPLFDPLYLAWSNYWDAMSFAQSEIYRRFPFKRNDLELGFGHEDWHWNCWTYESGVPHKPAPGTIHFKRRRRNSQMTLVDKADATVWPTAVLSHP